MSETKTPDVAEAIRSIGNRILSDREKSDAALRQALDLLDETCRTIEELERDLNRYHPGSYAGSAKARAFLQENGR